MCFFAILVCYTLSIEKHDDLKDISIKDVDNDDVAEMMEHFETNSGGKWGQIQHLLRKIREAKQSLKAKAKEKQHISRAEKQRIIKMKTKINHILSDYASLCRSLKNSIKTLSEEVLGKEIIIEKKKKNQSIEEL